MLRIIANLISYYYRNKRMGRETMVDLRIPLKDRAQRKDPSTPKVWFLMTARVYQWWTYNPL